MILDRTEARFAAGDWRGSVVRNVRPGFRFRLVVDRLGFNTTGRTGGTVTDDVEGGRSHGTKKKSLRTRAKFQVAANREEAIRIKNKVDGQEHPSENTTHKSNKKRARTKQQNNDK